MNTSDITSHSVSDPMQIEEQPIETSPGPTPGSSAAPFAYSEQSPLEEVSHDDLKNIVNSFNSSVAQYATGKDGKEVSAPPSEYKLKLDPRKLAPSYQENRKGQKEAAAKWNARSSDTQAMASRVLSSSDINAQRYNPDNPSETKSFSYNLGGGQSAGVMSLQHDQAGTEVKYLATHPGTSGAGETLIEKAVNESQANGNEGAISLTSLNSASDGFYNSMGFKGGVGDLTLNPSESELWRQKDGEWGLKKNDDEKGEKKGYLTEN